MNESPPVVIVRWRDSMSGIGGWHDQAEAVKFGKEAWDRPLWAAGFLIESNRRYIIIASGWNPVPDHEPEVNGTVIIPRSEVVSMVAVSATDD